jgi:hypothetical protein
LPVKKLLLIAGICGLLVAVVLYAAGAGASLRSGARRAWKEEAITYHFCIDMIVLSWDEQPEDLAAFAKKYYLRSFDGLSDQCLQKTWPPPKHD